MHEAASEALDFSELIGHHLGDHVLMALGPLAFTKHMLMISIAAVLATIITLIAARTQGKLRTALDAFVLFIRQDIAEPALGSDADAYLPYLLTLFLFIFVMNLLGLVPEAASATGNFSVTMMLSICTFFLIQGSGIKRHGFVHHFQNLIPHGVPLAVVPIVFAIEIMGFFIKAVALWIRLFANMVAGHLVILIFLGLILLFGQSNPRAGLVVSCVSVPLALGLYMLELLVAGIQAYVFTMLTAVFVGGVLNPEH